MGSKFDDMVKESLFTRVSPDDTKCGPRKITIVGVGMVGMACGMSVLMKVSVTSFQPILHYSHRVLTVRWISSSISKCGAVVVELLHDYSKLSIPNDALVTSASEKAATKNIELIY